MSGSPIDNAYIAQLLNMLADLMEIAGQPANRAAAYRRGARTVARLAEPIAQVAAQGRLQELPGIGPTLAARIKEIIATGTSPMLDELQAQVPLGVLELLRIPGLGPRTAHLLFKHLGITDVDGLEAALAAGRVAGLPGIGARTEERLRQEVAAYRVRTARVPLGTALPWAQELAHQLAQVPGVERVVPAGSIRRGRALVGNIDLVVAAGATVEPGQLAAAVPGISLAEPDDGQAPGGQLLRGVFQPGPMVKIPLHLHRCDPGRFPAVLHYATGARAHREELAGLAREQGLRLERDGLFRDEGGEKPLTWPEEESLYRHLGLPPVPPEVREGEGEVAAAAAGTLPRLVTRDDYRGDLHAHSLWSDGRQSIEAMVEAALARGYGYLAITDHSPSLTVARGLDPRRLAQQAAEIRAVRERFPQLLLLHGIEVDILADGSLDLPDDVLAGLDIVIASVHSHFQQDTATMTARIARAMANPHVDIIGHPTGRLLGQRDPYQVDMEELLAAAAETRTVLEINASPHRLDLPAPWARRAKEMGILLSVNTDAHSGDGLDMLSYGLLTARRAWLEAGDIINTMAPRALADWLALPKQERW